MLHNAHYIYQRISDPEKLSRRAQVGVDLTLKSVSEITDSSRPIIYNDKTGERVVRALYRKAELSSTGFFLLSPGLYSIEFDQGVTLSSTETAFIIQRSSLGRNGVLIQSSVYDPGFSTPNMGAIMSVHLPIEIEQHARVAQILFLKNREADEYNGQYQGEKDYR